MIRGIMIRKLSILCLSILFCGSVAWAADSAGNRKDSIIMLGMAPAGIHAPTIMAAPARVALILGDITVGIDAGSGTYDYSSTGWTSTTGAYTNQGLNARYFFGNSFNASLGYHMRNFSGTSTTTSWCTSLSACGANWLALQTETFTVDAKTSAATIGIGNHWLLDWGLWIGGDWVLASSGLGQTKEVTSTGTTTGSPTTTQRATNKKSAEAAADEVNDWSASSGFAVFTIGFAF